MFLRGVWAHDLISFKCCLQNPNPPSTLVEMAFHRLIRVLMSPLIHCCRSGMAKRLLTELWAGASVCSGTLSLIRPGLNACSP